MNAVMWHLVSPISWRIRPQDPSTIAVGAEFPGALLLNPILYGRVAAPHVEPLAHHVTALTDGDAIVRSPFLVLVHDDASGIPNGFARLFSIEAAQDGGGRIDRLLVKWRYLSKQVRLNALPLAWGGFHPVDLQPIPPKPFPEEKGSGRGLVPAWVVDGALTLAQVLQASSLPLDFEPPLYDTLLLDAGAAWGAGDYRKAILFSVFAMEGAAKEALGEAYERALAARPATLRVVDIQTNAGSVTKDPVYAALCEGTKFDRMLHERPLYIMGRSMLLEVPDLYAMAKRLYGTRNKLAHGVEPGDDQTNVLPLDSEGAGQAIDCAIRFLAWFGKGAAYHRPRFGHVETRGCLP